MFKIFLTHHLKGFIQEHENFLKILFLNKYKVTGHSKLKRNLVEKLIVIKII